VGAQHIWQPLLQQAFGKEVTLQPAFSVDMQTVAQPPKTIVKFDIPQRQTTPATNTNKPAYTKPQSANRSQSQVKVNEKKVDVSDATTWQKANELVQAFDGIVTQEEDGPHE
jgi:hypothetical protein